MRRIARGIGRWLACRGTRGRHPTWMATALILLPSASTNPSAEATFTKSKTGQGQPKLSSGQFENRRSDVHPLANLMVWLWPAAALFASRTFSLPATTRMSSPSPKGAEIGAVHPFIYAKLEIGSTKSLATHRRSIGVIFDGVATSTVVRLHHQQLTDCCVAANRLSGVSIARVGIWRRRYILMPSETWTPAPPVRL